MKVHYLKEDYQIENAIYVLGSFESLHLGHYELFKIAFNSNKHSVIMLIEDPCDMPKTVGKPYAMLETRLQMAADVGFEYAIIVNFNEVKNYSPEKFISILTKDRDDVEFVCGSDFKYGARGKGTTTILKKLYDEKTHIVDLRKIHTTKIATSIIKEQIPLGYVEFANQMTIYDFSLVIKIDENNKFDWPNIVNLHPGIYAASIESNGFKFFVILYKNIKNECFIELIDGKLKSQNLINEKLILNIYSEIRHIINERLDELTTNDYDDVKQYFIDENKKEKKW